jgi:hypothetical protein
MAERAQIEQHHHASPSLAGMKDGPAHEGVSAGIDPDALADRAAVLREGREVEERHQAQEVAREQERVKELECQQEIERENHRDRGHGIER